jgi:hypothetical protein
MNNTKRKELGLWVTPSPMCIAARAARKKSHRLFNPLKKQRIERSQLNDVTFYYLEIKDIIRASKHGLSLDTFLLELWVNGIIPKVVEITNNTPYTQRVHTKLVFRPRRPSMFDLNTEWVKLLGYKYKTSRSVSKRIARQVERHALKIGKTSIDGLNCKQRREKEYKRKRKLKQAS